MNLSLGGPGSPTSPLAREVDALAAEGIIVCFAAGNARPGARTISSPGDARGALTVAAADKESALAFYSSRGPVPGVLYGKPDVVAIGGGVTQGAACAYGTGVASARAQALAKDPCTVAPRYVRMSGTSMATPHVAGICAVMLQAIGDDRASVVTCSTRVRRALIGSARAMRGTTKKRDWGGPRRCRAGARAAADEATGRPVGARRGGAAKWADLSRTIRVPKCRRTG